MQFSKILKSPKLLSSIILNFLPIYGVFSLGWFVGDLLAIYLWEIGISALFALVGIRSLLSKNKDRRMEIWRRTRIANLYFVFFLILALMSAFILWGDFSRGDLLFSGGALIFALIFAIKEYLTFSKSHMLAGPQVEPATDAISTYLYSRFVGLSIFVSFFLITILFAWLAEILSPQMITYAVLIFMVLSQVSSDIIFSRAKISTNG